MLSQKNIDEAYELLRKGEAVIMPTDTVAGLFAIDTPEACELLKSIKGRSGAKPIARMFGSRKQISERVLITNQVQELAMQRLLPGKVTLIFPSRNESEGTIGVRLPMDASLRALIRRTGPLLATSANLSGEGTPETGSISHDMERVAHLIGAYDPSGAPLNMASTVVDLTSERPRILRKGAASIWTIARRLNATPYLPAPEAMRVLFVCGGNTCRSPMAQAMFSSLCREDRVESESAGLSAADGEMASSQSIEVMREYSISLDSHRSRRLSPEMVSRADVILVMTRAHLLRIRRAHPEEASKTFLLSGFPEPWPRGRQIDDPIGRPLEVYRKTREAIKAPLGTLCKEISKFLN